MKILPAGIELIKSREACRLKAYLCPAGIWTIGYGHTGPEVHDGWEIEQGEANALLMSDLILFDGAVQKTCPDASPGQHSAMVDLCYNIGAGAFSKSSVARLHNSGKYPEAAQAFALWNKAGGKVLAGLVSRRAAEADMYIKGTPDDALLTESLAPTAEGEKPLSQSRGINGQTIAAAGTVATAAMPTFKDHADTINQITDQLGGITPYLPQIGYAIAALTLAGIAWSMYARWHDRNQGRA